MNRDKVSGRRYRCVECSATKCKLWQDYRTPGSKLLCAKCAGVDQCINVSDIDENGQYTGYLGVRTNQIGWYAPAITSTDGDELVSEEQWMGLSTLSWSIAGYIRLALRGL